MRRVPTGSKPLSVDVADAGGTVVDLPERLVEGLRRYGIAAALVALDDIVRTSADAVVLRGDAPGVLAILRALRDDGTHPDTPVLLLGTPEGTGPFDEGPGFGAQHVLPKHSSVSRIAEALHVIVGREPRPDVPDVRAEHTMQLGRGGADWRTHTGLRRSDPPGPPAAGAEPPEVVSEIIRQPERSAVFLQGVSDAEANEPPTREPRPRLRSVPPPSDSGAPGLRSVPPEAPLGSSSDAPFDSTIEPALEQSVVAPRPLPSGPTGPLPSPSGSKPPSGNLPSSGSTPLGTGSGSVSLSSSASLALAPTGSRPAGPASVPPSSSSGSIVTPGSSIGTSSVPSTSQLFVVASISDELRAVLYEADRRVFPDRPPIDVSIPRGEEAARDLVPDEFVEGFSLALDEADRSELELTFVGTSKGEERRSSDAPASSPPPPSERPRSSPPPAWSAPPAELAPNPDASEPSGFPILPGEGAPELDDEGRPKTSPGTPTSLSRRPLASADTRSVADGPALRPRLGEASERPRAPDVRADSRSPDPRALDLRAPDARVEFRELRAPRDVERGELSAHAALGLVARLALGGDDARITLTLAAGPLTLTLMRGEWVDATGEAFATLRRPRLHQTLEASFGRGRATELVRSTPTFAVERASRIADEEALIEALLDAAGPYTIEPAPTDRAADVPPARRTRHPLAATLLELGQRLSDERAERVMDSLAGAPSTTAAAASRLARLAQLEIARGPLLERLLESLDAPRELAWLVLTETARGPASVAQLVAAAPDEPGLLGALVVLVAVGALSLRRAESTGSLAHTDLDVRAEQALASLRDRARHADYFTLLGLPRDADGAQVTEAHRRLRRELLAWPLGDLGLVHLEADRLRALAALDEALEVLGSDRLRARYAHGLTLVAQREGRRDLLA